MYLMVPNNGNDLTNEQRLMLELRRGTVALAVLGALRTPAYGYSLQQKLAERKFEVDQGTLYPLLRRLEEQGLLTSDWTVDEERPRKYYRLSQEGFRVLEGLTGQWARLVQVIDDLLGAEDPDAKPGVAAKGEGHDTRR
jgi:DNA-binding PadR family transcriptional regulator